MREFDIAYIKTNKYAFHLLCHFQEHIGAQNTSSTVRYLSFQGGQILRNTVALSSILGIPVVVNNIRAGRSKPGLR